MVAAAVSVAVFGNPVTAMGTMGYGITMGVSVQAGGAGNGVRGEGRLGRGEGGGAG